MTTAQAKRKLSLSALFELAVKRHQEGAHEEAGRLYRSFLAKVPGHARAWTNYGSLLRTLGIHDAAIGCHRKALQIDPKLEQAQINLSNAYADSGRYEEALTLREPLLAAQPEDMKRLRDTLVALRGLWRHDEVIARADAAEAAVGTAALGEVQLQRGLSHLMLGNYAEGFRDFEARYAGDEVSLPANAPWPLLGKGMDVAGKTVLVLPEQGFGDAILMSRFLPGLAAMGAEVTMVVKKPLRRLFARLEGVSRIVDQARTGDPFDFYTPNMSLPHIVGCGPDNAPPPAPRLAIPEDSRARARALVAPFRDRFKVGVVWTGSLTYKANHRRSAGALRFLDLATVPGVQLFSLYKGAAHGEFLESGAAGLILDACGDDRDFADSAAVIDEMDLMITTDTAVVHVAASLGKEVWNLLNAEGFWLYGMGDKTPWYPSMTLYRQPANGDWESVFARVERDLRARVGAPQFEGAA